MEKKSLIIQKIIQNEILILVFLLPFFFLPITSDFFYFSKNVLLALGVLIILATNFIKMIFARKVTFIRTRFDLPVLLFCLSFIASTIFSSTAKVESLLIFGGTGTIIGLTLLYFLITNSFKDEEKMKLVHVLSFGGVLLSLFTIAQFFNLNQIIIPVTWLKDKTFTPTGNFVNLAVFLTILLIFQGLNLSKKLVSNKNLGFFIPHLLGIATAVTGLGFTLYILISLIKPVFLPQIYGWAIAIEALKLVPFFGLGPENFLSAFNQFRPLGYNASPVWNIIFDSSSNYYFQLLTTVGVLGLGSFLFLVWKIIIGPKNPFMLVLVTALIIFALLPFNFLGLFLFFVILALLSLSSASEYSEESRILPWTLSLPGILLIVVAFYFIGRAFVAEVDFKKSLDAMAKNDGTNTYNSQVSALTLNPYRITYRLAYSQTNLALANSLASQKELSDQDRQNISTLIQQAIQEAKGAISLNPQNVQSWENLANLYRQLINFAQGADQWTIAAYQQTIALDPLNPYTRIALGGVYFSLKNWDEAIKTFEQAIAVKNDLANSHYNLSAAYREKGDFEKAAAEMEKVILLVPAQSEDWSKAKGELEGLQTRLKSKTPQTENIPSESLTTPEPLPSGLKPPLTLPTDAAPEVTPIPTEVTPTPSISL